MGNYGLQEVIRRWKQEDLTVQQTIGQILLLLKTIEQRLEELERSLARAKQNQR